MGANMTLIFTNPEFEDLIKDGIKKHTIRADKWIFKKTNMITQILFL